MGSKVEHPFKVEVWEGDKVHETLAVISHATVAIAAYEAAIRERQGRVVTLRHGARVLRTTEPARPPANPVRFSDSEVGAEEPDQCRYRLWR